MENIMELSTWVILLIIAVPVLFVLNDKYGWIDSAVGKPPAPAEEPTFKAPSANKLMKFTKKELIEFAENNNIVVTPSKTKSEIIKQIRKK
jgi:hypothetical protein|tara:strand:+ start:562 stop:834 length:273 start_codon:yes stop_codon:yes gene_type:complete